jgi:hypothetical protein
MYVLATVKALGKVAFCDESSVIAVVPAPDPVLTTKVPVVSGVTT